MVLRRSFWPGAQKQYTNISEKILAYAEPLVLQLTLVARRQAVTRKSKGVGWEGVPEKGNRGNVHVRKSNKLAGFY